MTSASDTFNKGAVSLRFGLGQLQEYTLINYEKFSLQHRGAIIWNSLPNVLKELKSLKHLRNISYICTIS